MSKKVKSIVLFLVVLAVFACAGCRGKSEMEEGRKYAEPSENQFDAKVLEVHEEYLVVEALEDQTIAGKVQVWTGLLSEDDLPELEEDMLVRITHDGKMTMSLPPQMSAVEKIIIISQWAE